MAVDRLRSAAVVFHPDRRHAVEAGERLGVELSSAGVDVFTGSAFDSESLRAAVSGRELVVALGGDGTILAVGRETAGLGAPTLGVNMGHVGFLAELTPALIADSLPRLLRKEFWVERRCVLEASWRQDDDPMRHQALNEVALARGTSTRAIRVAVSVDGFEFTTQTADGVMVATATGSTAYSLAAGGPIMYPEAREMLLTPVAPHLHIGRTVVLPSSAVVCLELRGDREAMLAIDGQTECPLDIGTRVEIRRSRNDALFARLGPRTYFFSVLSDRLR